MPTKGPAIPMLIAQITDLHVRPPGKLAYDRVDTNRMLEACIHQIATLDPAPDVVIASGDLTDCGLPEEYEELKRILSPLTTPVYLIPGNHDRRENMISAFPDHPYLVQFPPFIQYTIDAYPMTLIGLDSVVPSHSHGELCEERLNWLSDALEARREKPAILFLHHPPFPTGIADMDAINCLNGADLAAIVEEHPNIERVLAGHHHRPIQIRWAGTIGSVAPSTAHQVTLDLSDTDRDASFIMEPPAFHLHLWTSASGVISHTGYVGPYDGPHPFLDDPDYPGVTEESVAA